MLVISLVGNGNLGSHFAKVIDYTEGLMLAYHYDRSGNDTNKKFSDLINIPCDICILCVSDRSITEISEKLINKNCLIVHTSGAVDIRNLKNPRKGVCYPVQTFCKKSNINWIEIPICIETKQKFDLRILRKFSEKISDRVLELSSPKRLALHLAAVFANNFTNTLYNCAYEICNLHQISPGVLHPLMLQTAKNAVFYSPKNVQTGPAKRKDFSTKAKHMELLESPLREIYRSISQIIQDQHDK